MPHADRKASDPAAEPHRFDPDAAMHADSNYPGILVVDLDALARNFRRLRDAAAPSACAAVVKANAYGLGVAPVARRLAREGCGRFFVATAAEGVELRGLIPDAPIYVFEGVTDAELTAFAEARLTPVLNSLQQIDCWRRGGGAAAILHVDTGMARLGLSEAEVRELARRRERLSGLRIDYVMTHLACADTPAHALNALQLERFELLRSQLPAAPTSIANSAGVLLGRDYCGDLARVGIALYGGNPRSHAPNPVEPVVTLRGRILQLREVAAATTVGYGATHDASPPCSLAICGVGYADGYPRAAGNRCDASFRGRRVPVVGRVSMDLACVDVSAVPASEIAVGDYVDFIGGGIALDEVAAAAGTIGYEILTGFGPRLGRRYVEVA